MEIIQEIGSYAGFAAVLGLAVLSALYFSQARDVRALREAAGQAREAAAQQEIRVRPGANRDASAGTATASSPAATAAVQRAVQPAGVATGAASGGGPPPPRVAPPLRTGQRPAVRPPMANRPSATVAPPPAQGRRRGLRGLPARYVALIAAGVLVTGGAVAYGVVQLSGDDSQPASQAGEEGAPEGDGGPAGAPDPAGVTVSFLNGTTVVGLAADVADRIEASGYRKGNVANATEQGARAESVVLYTEGAAPEARLIARELGISQREPADSTSRALAGDATVIVIVGADLIEQ